MRLIYCVILALTIGGDVSRASAQLLDTPRPVSDGLRIAELTLNERSVSHVELGTNSAEASVLVRTSPASVPRVADFKFYALNGLHLGMAVFDVEMTQRCIAVHHCEEANPVLPSSQAGQLSVNFALVAFTSGVSYWLKKRHEKLWWLPPATSAGAHGIGAVTGFEHQ
jgi:hypothetical protein